MEAEHEHVSRFLVFLQIRVSLFRCQGCRQSPLRTCSRLFAPKNISTKRPRPRELPFAFPFPFPTAVSFSRFKYFVHVNRGRHRAHHVTRLFFSFQLFIAEHFFVAADKAHNDALFSLRVFPSVSFGIDLYMHL